MKIESRLLVVICLAAVAMSLGRPALAQFIFGGFSDIRPSVSGNQLVTNAHDDSSGNDVPNVRVFEYRFQNDPGDPYFTQDPGFNAAAGALPPASFLSFDVLSSLTYWSGTGTVSTTSPPPASEQIQLNFGIQNTFISGSSGAEPGFVIGNISSNGSLHKHLNAFLLASDGNADPGDGVVATNGVFFTSIRINTGAGVASSLPLYLVYGNGASDAAFFSAVKYVRDNFAPGTNLANVVSSWAVDANGVWSSASNWTGGVPQGVSIQANLTGAITAPRVVTVDAPQTVGTINFDNNNSYTLSGPGTVTLQMFNATCGVNILSGSHTITAPLNAKNNLVVNVIQSASKLTISGDLLMDPGLTLSKTSDGALETKNIRADSFAMSAGTMGGGATRILANGSASGTSVVKSLSIADGTTFDLTNNSLIVDYTGASPIGTIRTWIKRGYGSGSWDGTGITSSTAAADATGPHRTAIGYAEASELGVGSFGGQSVDSTSVLARYTLAGDANLDGKVDFIDLGDLATHWQAGGDWVGGDFNYDGVVDVNDLSLLAINWQAGVGGTPAESAADAIARLGLPDAVLPEPSTALLFIASISLQATRGRRCVRPGRPSIRDGASTAN